MPKHFLPELPGELPCTNITRVLLFAIQMGNANFVVIYTKPKNW